MVKQRPLAGEQLLTLGTQDHAIVRALGDALARAVEAGRGDGVELLDHGRVLHRLVQSRQHHAAVGAHLHGELFERDEGPVPTRIQAHLKVVELACGLGELDQALALARVDVVEDAQVVHVAGDGAAAGRLHPAQLGGGEARAEPVPHRLGHLGDGHPPLVAQASQGIAEFEPAQHGPGHIRHLRHLLGGSGRYGSEAASATGQCLGNVPGETAYGTCQSTFRGTLSGHQPSANPGRAPPPEPHRGAPGKRGGGSSMARLERPRGDGRYIVDCPACAGTGRIRQGDSVVLTGCRLCWERGVCSPIVANRYRKKLADAGEGAG